MRCPTCGFQIDQDTLDRCPTCGNWLPTQAAQSTSENPPSQPGAGPQPPGYPPSGYWQPGPYSQPLPPGGYPHAAPFPPAGYPPAQPPHASLKGLLIGLAVGVLELLCTGGLFLGLVGHAITPTTASGATFATATATTAPTPTAVRTVVYQNTFAANADGWTQNSHCFEGAGGYHIANDYACYAPIGAQTDVDISVKAKQLTGNTAHPFGIVFGRDDANNEYRFMVNSGMWAVVGCRATTCSLVMDGGADQWGVGADIALEVNITGKHFVFNINGVRADDFDVASYTGGRAGLAVSGAIEVVFSDLVIARIA